MEGLPTSKSAIELTVYTTRSKRTALLQTVVRPFRPRLVKSSKEFLPGSPRLSPARCVYNKCSVNERELGGVWIYDLVSRTGKSSFASEMVPSRVKHRFFYIAGGGYASPPSKQHWNFVVELLNRLSSDAEYGTVVLSVISCPLAPACPAHVTIPWLIKVCRQLLIRARNDRESVSFVGDSSGASIVIGVTLKILEDRTAVEDEVSGGSEQGQGSGDADVGFQHTVKSVLVICPNADCANTNPSMDRVGRHDPILTVPYVKAVAERWQGQFSPLDAVISPARANFQCLVRHQVRLHGILAGYDVLAPDGYVLRRRCEEMSVQGEWLEWDKQMHCFPLAWRYGLPESVVAKEWIVSVLRKDIETE